MQGLYLRPIILFRNDHPAGDGLSEAQASGFPTLPLPEPRDIRAGSPASAERR
jgi:hypothetical protein